ARRLRLPCLFLALPCSQPCFFLAPPCSLPRFLVALPCGLALGLLAVGFLGLLALGLLVAALGGFALGARLLVTLVLSLLQGGQPVLRLLGQRRVGILGNEVAQLAAIAGIPDAVPRAAFFVGRAGRLGRLLRLPGREGDLVLVVVSRRLSPG